MNAENPFIEGPVNVSMPSSTVIPVLEYPDVAAASAWLCNAFGFSERLRIGSHRTQLSAGTGAIVVTQAKGANGMRFGEGYAVMVRVRDADLHCEHARQAGANVTSEPSSQPYGERQYTAQDHVGRSRVFSQTIGNVEPSAWGGELLI